MITRAYWLALLSLLVLWAYTYGAVYRNEFDQPRHEARFNP